MKNLCLCLCRPWSLVLAALLLAAPTARAGELRPAREHGVPGRYVVVLRPEAARLKSQAQSKLPTVRQNAMALAHAHGGRVTEVWQNALRGFVIEASAETAKRLALDSRVLFVEQDAAAPAEASSPTGRCFPGTSTHLANSRPLPPLTSPQSLICDNADPSQDLTAVGQPPRCRDNWGLDQIDQQTATRDAQYTFDRTGRIPGAARVNVFVLDHGVNAQHQAKVP